VSGWRLRIVELPEIVRDHDFVRTERRGTASASPRSQEHVRETEHGRSRGIGGESQSTSLFEQTITTKRLAAAATAFRECASHRHLSPAIPKARPDQRRRS
jgi:hypothetical protein